MLATVVLGRDDDTCRLVGNTHGTVGGVDMLTTGTGCTIGVDFQIAFVNLYLETVVDYRIDPDAGKAGMTFGSAIVRRNTHEPMDAAFGFGKAIGILASDFEGGRLDTSLISSLIIDHRDFIAARFRPALIHTQQHFCPVLAFRPASTRVNFQISIEIIGFT